MGVLKRKSNIFGFSLQYTDSFPESGSRKRFQGSGMRAIDSRLEKPKNRRFSHKNLKMSDFRFKTPTPSLNQGQGSIFTFWGCAQSISHMILPLKMIFLEKNFFSRGGRKVDPPLRDKFLIYIQFFQTFVLKEGQKENHNI